jgi:valyl-tRNA synthetase
MAQCVGEFPADTAAEPEMRWVMQAVLGVRQIRGEMDIAPSAPPAAAAAERRCDGSGVSGAQSRHCCPAGGIGEPRALGIRAAPIRPPPWWATLEMLVPMAGLIDPKRSCSA